MDTKQAIIILNNGLKKYGTIISEECNEQIKFISGIEMKNMNDILLNHKIEHIPIHTIFSIDTFLK